MNYCTNWNVDEEGTKKFGFYNADIAYMTSKNPLGPFEYKGVVLRNPGKYYGCYGNNHHCMFTFNGEMYIAYHTQILEQMMGISGGYRSTAISKVTVAEDGSLPTIPSVDRHSLVQQKYLNPYERVEAETMATMGGLSTTQADEVSKKCGSGNMELCDIKSGSWLALYGVDFGADGAAKFTAAVKAPAGCEGAMQIRLDGLDGEVVGYLDISEGADNTYKEITAELLKTVTGVHNLVFVFYGENYNVDYWQFQ